MKREPEVPLRSRLQRPKHSVTKLQADARSGSATARSSYVMIYLSGNAPTEVIKAETSWSRFRDVAPKGTLESGCKMKVQSKHT